jgi:hypothetical protein
VPVSKETAMRGVEELASLEESRELAKVPPDELRMDLVNAIESLSPSHREVLLLRGLEDLTIGEIAGRLGVTREALEHWILLRNWNILSVEMSLRSHLGMLKHGFQAGISQQR